MRLRVGSCYQNVPRAVEPFSDKGKVYQVVFAALRYNSEEHELLSGYSIHSSSACQTSKWARRSRSVAVVGFRQFGLVPSVSVLADFALLGGRLFQGENTNTGLLFPLTIPAALPHSLAGGCIRLRAIPASTLVLTQVRRWEHQFCLRW